MMKKYYRISEFSLLTSVTVRTLHHYDAIGLLKPSVKTASKHRLYSEEDLLRLQQISTLKYMGFSLSSIKSLIARPDFNVAQALALQAQLLNDEAQRITEAASLLNFAVAQVEAKQAIKWRQLAKIIEILESNKMSEQMSKHHIGETELGKAVDYKAAYHPDKLLAIPRQGKRAEIGINENALPFFGFDLWNHYEVSWLNTKGKPIVAVAEIAYDSHSPYIVESKSLKLYFNSFNNMRFSTQEELANLITKDLSEKLQTPIYLTITPLKQIQQPVIAAAFDGICLDELDVNCSAYEVNSEFLTTHDKLVQEVLYSDLLKSNCLVTMQPDWGSIKIAYEGKQIDHAGLLQYIVSFRDHNEFHEQCIERIFMDIMTFCQPKKLTVYGRYTRRGGLDINPYRSTEKTSYHDQNIRLYRQ